MLDKIQTPRHAQGRRPQYFDEAPLDQLHAMIIALTGEVSVLADRLDTVEVLLDQKGTISRDDIETFALTDDIRERRREKRSKYIARVFRSVSDARAAIEKSESDKSYAQTIDEDSVTG